MCRIITKGLTRSHPLKIHGFDAVFQAGDMYVPITGYTVRDNKVRRVYKAIGGGVLSLWTYNVVACSESGNTFRVRFYDEPGHTELGAVDLSDEIRTGESPNFLCLVD